MCSIMNAYREIIKGMARGSIIPGNLNSGHPTEKCIFHLKLSLGAEEREGQLHRVIETESILKKGSHFSYARTHCLKHLGVLTLPAGGQKCEVVIGGGISCEGLHFLGHRVDYIFEPRVGAKENFQQAFFGELLPRGVHRFGHPISVKKHILAWLER